LHKTIIQKDFFHLKLIFSIFYEFWKVIESFQNLSGETFAFPLKLFYTEITIHVQKFPETVFK